MTDTMGNLMRIRVHAANIHDTKSSIYTFEKALYGIRRIRLGVQMAVIEGHVRILLNNFTHQNRYFYENKRTKRNFRFFQNVGLLNVLLHG